jgi:transcriptional regulator with XRE-family HTH domain
MNELDNISVGALLRKRRLERHLTQGEVAAALGLSQPGYSNIERGNVHLASKYFDAVEGTLGLKPAVLMEHLLGLANDTERCIAADRRLTKAQRRLMLMIYGELTGRESVNVLGWYEEAESDQPVSST